MAGDLSMEFRAREFKGSRAAHGCEHMETTSILLLQHSLRLLDGLGFGNGNRSSDALERKKEREQAMRYRYPTWQIQVRIGLSPGPTFYLLIGRSLIDPLLY